MDLTEDPLPSGALLPGFGAQKDLNHPKTGTPRGRVQVKHGGRSNWVELGAYWDRGVPGGGELSAGVMAQNPTSPPKCTAPASRGRTGLESGNGVGQGVICPIGPIPIQAGSGAELPQEPLVSSQTEGAWGVTQSENGTPPAALGLPHVAIRGVS